MNEKELQEFLKMVTPMLKELPQEEIEKQLNEIDMSAEEKEQFLQVILLLKENDGIS